jgi:hypothetical protein
MRSIIIILLAACTCSNVASAQQKTIVPASVKLAFANAYPGATKVKWEKEDGLYEASFHYKNDEMSVLYTQQGAVSETETAIAIKELPPAALKYASSKGKIKDAAKIVSPNGNVQYEAEVNGKDLLFDSKGLFLKQKAENQAEEKK